MAAHFPFFGYPYILLFNFYLLFHVAYAINIINDVHSANGNLQAVTSIYRFHKFNKK